MKINIEKGKMRCNCGFTISLNQWSYVNLDFTFCKCGTPYSYFKYISEED